MEHVQILLLVAFLFLVNIAQMADENNTPYGVPVVEESIPSKSSGAPNE